MEVPRRTFYTLLAVSNPKHPNFREWLERYHKLLDELAQPPLSDIARQLALPAPPTAVLTSQNLYDYFRDRYGSRDAWRFAEQTFNAWFVFLDHRVKFYCVEQNLPKWRCTCAALMERHAQRIMYHHLTTRGLHRYWQVAAPSLRLIDETDLAKLSPQSAQHTKEFLGSL